MMIDLPPATRPSWCPPDLTDDELRAVCEEWRREELRIVFTNGCFDVLHVGHLELLDYARKNSDRLVIGLNPDHWVTQHKGPSRPVQSAAIRRAVAHRMANADLSIIFEEESPERMLSIIKPNLYVLGSDYREANILGREHCGEVVFLERLPGVSTTNCLKKVKEN